MIFEEQSTIEHMVFRILTHMQSLIQCQRVQVRNVYVMNDNFPMTAQLLHRFCSYMKHPKEVFHVYSISKLMMISMKELGTHKIIISYLN